MTGAAANGRYLIYLICIGEAFRRYAAMAIASIRKVGAWRHDVVLLSDSEKPLDGCQDVTVIDIFSAARARYPWLAMKRHTVPHLKTELEYHVDLAAYDYVLYLDSDLLVTNGRLPELVSAFQREQAIVVQHDIIPVASGRRFAGGRILTQAEQRQWGSFAINAGIVGFPTTPMGRRLFRDWRQLNQDMEFKSTDQANLISLLLRKYHGQWGYVADAAFGRELRPYPQTFLHFTTHKDALMEAYYTQVLGLTLPA
jgi:hypothetical protein